MSQYSRAEFNANAGIVVGVSPADYAIGITPADCPEARSPGSLTSRNGSAERTRRRRHLRRAGPTGRRPPRKPGVAALGGVMPSYKPAVQPADLAACLPGFAIEAIREALRHFARDIPGFAMHDAVLTGVETRTSSPIRISRDADGHSLNTKGLFPAGEGAGYAGGIMSAGVDGIRVAEAVASNLTGAPLVERMTRGEGAGVYGQP